MANMSYCRFENTYQDLVDCFYNMEEAKSESEKRFRDRLISLCEEIVDNYAQFDFDEEEFDEE